MIQSPRPCSVTTRICRPPSGWPGCNRRWRSAARLGAIASAVHSGLPIRARYRLSRSQLSDTILLTLDRWAELIRRVGWVRRGVGSAGRSLRPAARNSGAPTVPCMVPARGAAQPSVDRQYIVLNFRVSVTLSRAAPVTKNRTWNSPLARWWGFGYIFGPPWYRLRLCRAGMSLPHSSRALGNGRCEGFSA